MGNGRYYDKPCIYAIQVKGNLDPRWADWFDGLAISPGAGDETALTGPVQDQAALYGILNKIGDLGLPLLQVKRVEAVDREGPDAANPQRREGEETP